MFSYNRVYEQQNNGEVGFLEGKCSLLFRTVSACIEITEKILVPIVSQKKWTVFFLLIFLMFSLTFILQIQPSVRKNHIVLN